MRRRSASQAALVERLRELSDPDLVLSVTIDGIAPDTFELDPDELERTLAGDRSCTSGSVTAPRPSWPMAPDLPEDTVAGQVRRST